MNWLLRTFLSSGLMKARIKNGINAASLVAGGWVMSHMLDWLEAHATFFSRADNMAIAGTVASAVAGLVLTAGGAIYTTVIDPNKVAATVTTAAVMGTTQAADNPAVRADVVAAVKTGQIAVPDHPAPNLDDVIAQREAAARGG